MKLSDIKKYMPVYLFHLGHQPLLSRAEILSVINTQKISFSSERQAGNLLFIETSKPIDAARFINQLGGTVKIMEHLPEVQPKPSTVAKYLHESIPSGKINFSLSGAPFALLIKKELKNLDRSVRYIEPKNTATILHNDLVNTNSDITIFENKVFITKGIQDLEGFSERDYGRPQADSKSGMLPPKLARMMLNLTGASHDDIVLDPFCGSGTVLMEAADLGFLNIAGTDLSLKAIQDSEKNLTWLRETKKIKPVTKLKVADAQQLSREFSAQSIDAIVAEPYMGKPQTGRESLRELQNSARELRQLFEKAFAEFAIILKSGASVVFIIPEFTYQKETITIDCLDTIKKLGFNIVPLLPKHESILYQRPGQHVARRIWKFQLEK